MGKPKLLLPFGEKTIIEAVVSNAVQSKADKILVVLGSDAEKIEEKIKSSFLEKSLSKKKTSSFLEKSFQALGKLEMSVNPNFRQGMLSSIQWGFGILPEDARAALVMLGDQPLIPGLVIDKIIYAYNQSGKGIVIPVYNKKRGHPILVDIKYRDEVKRINPELSLRVFVHNHAEDILEVEVDTPGILKDIDTVEDYNREIRPIS